MVRKLKVAAAQVGRIDLDTPRSAVLNRMKKLLDQAHAQGVKLVLFPETTFTTFFPRFLFPDEELNQWFEKEDKDPSTGITNAPNVKEFYAHAKKLGIDVVAGYGEETPDGDRYNTCSYVQGNGKVLSKYRKVHLPGSFEPFNDKPETVNQLEKRYFLPGNLGFEAFRVPSLKPKSDHDQKDPICGMLICNDRRWAEAWRCYGLQGIEILLCGYNTTAWSPDMLGFDPNMPKDEARENALFHHKLTLQCHAYTNSTFAIAAGRCGWDDNKYELIAGSVIINPQGKIVAESKTNEDELVVAEIDLDECRPGKDKVFNFGKHRRVEAYQRIVDNTGVQEPA